MIIAELPQGGAGAWAMSRKVKALAATTNALCADVQERATMIEKFMKSGDAYDVVLEFGGKGRRLDLGESEFILDLVGSQQAYRKLASKLKHAFGCIVLEPIQNIMSEHTLFKVSDFSLLHNTVDDAGVETAQKVTGWYSAEVRKEMMEELNDFGPGRFVPRRFADNEDDNTVAILFGGDGGGESFKHGLVVLNQETPQSPLNVRWTGSMRGAPDKYEVLSKTAFAPGFTTQINALRKTKLLHVVSLASGIEPSTGTVFVPKSMPVRGLDDMVVCTPGEAKLVATQELLEEKGTWGCLAVLEDAVVGVAVLQRRPVAEGVRVDEWWRAALFVDPSTRPESESAADKVRNAFAASDDFATIKCHVASFLGDGDGLVDTVVGLLPLLEPLPLGQLMLEFLGVRLFLTGDWAFLSVMLGHMGAAAGCLCPVCVTTKADARRGVVSAWRTHTQCCSCAGLNPLKGSVGKKRKRIQGTAAYKANAFLSIEFEPLLELEPRRDVSCAPLHFVLGEVWRAFKLALERLGKIDKTQDDAIRAALEIAGLRAAGAELDEKLKELETDEASLRADVTKKETAVDKKKKSLEEAKGRVAAATASRGGAPKRTKDLVTKLTVDVERQTGAIADLKKQLASLQKDVKGAKSRTAAAAKKVEDEAKKDAAVQGVLVTELYKSLSQHHIVIYAWFQKFVGNHAVKLLKNTAQIWKDLASAASHLKEEPRSRFDELRGDFEPLWKNLNVIVQIILSKEELSEEDISNLETSVSAYLADVTRLVPVDAKKEPGVPLKRHGLKHTVQNAKDRHQVGLLAESVFESFHVQINNIDSRTCHIMNIKDRNKCTHKPTCKRALASAPCQETPQQGSTTCQLNSAPS